VELSAPSVHPLVRPWRIATLVASAFAAFELLVLLIIGIAFVGKPLSAHAKEAALTRATGIAQVPSRPEPRNTTLSRAETSVLVLNGNGIAGAAAETASRVRARGYTVAATGNARTDSSGQTLVMYRPGRRPEAQRLARDLGVRLVGPLDGMSVRNLLGAQVVLVVGS
jgi:hypothetical protein